MSRFQVEFHQVLHRFAPYHPVAILVLLFTLTVVSVGLFGLQFKEAPTSVIPADFEESLAEAGQAFDQLEAYLAGHHPMDGVAETFAREAPPPAPRPAKEMVEEDEEVLEVTLPPIPVLRLSAVFDSGGQPLAEIDDKLFSLGDSVVPGCRLVEIEGEQVWLEMDDGRKFKLVLYDEKKDSSTEAGGWASGAR